MRRLLAVALLSLSCCSGSKDLQASQQAIARFHAELNQAQFDQIYAESSPDWKQATKQADTIKLFSAIHTKLGLYINGKQDAWRVNYGSGGNTVVVQLQSKYQKGNATELFTLTDSGGSAQLIGYNINSLALLPG